ncbi:MarR family transcriptional regulator [Haloarchaeobius amylolyticus]|uniref:MarR family transcriptional regulator n=1 Tax=Haloarchaeobius amylolyticus TaxID=1198296 RepID=A0ABD6BK27_9EURY
MIVTVVHSRCIDAENVCDDTSNDGIMTRVPDRIYDLPPSGKLVLKVLDINGELTQSQIATETRLNKRTVRSALDALRDADILRERMYFRDAGQSLYSISDSALAEESTAMDH